MDASLVGVMGAALAVGLIAGALLEPGWKRSYAILLASVLFGLVAGVVMEAVGLAPW
jgi:hypothetical protein